MSRARRRTSGVVGSGIDVESRMFETGRDRSSAEQRGIGEIDDERFGRDEEAMELPGGSFTAFPQCGRSELWVWGPGQRRPQRRELFVEPCEVRGRRRRRAARRRDS